MSRPDDPYGKRSLFSSPPNGTSEGPHEEAAQAGSNAAGEGRRALFSSATPVRHDAGRRARLECSSCRESSDIGAVALVRRMVPSLIFPGLRWPVYMRCPVCAEMTWCAIDWRPLIRL